MTERAEKPAKPPAGTAKAGKGGGEKRLSLHSPTACRREMGRVYRDARNGKIPTADGSRLVYMLERIVQTYLATDIEERLAALEAAQGKRRK